MPVDGPSSSPFLLPPRATCTPRPFLIATGRCPRGAPSPLQQAEGSLEALCTSQSRRQPMERRQAPARRGAHTQVRQCGAHIHGPVLGCLPCTHRGRRTGRECLGSGRPLWPAGPVAVAPTPVAPPRRAWDSRAMRGGGSCGPEGVATAREAASRAGACWQGFSAGLAVPRVAQPQAELSHPVALLPR